MKWEVSYSVKFVLDETNALENNFDLRIGTYDCKADSAEEAVKSTQQHIIEIVSSSSKNFIEAKIEGDKVILFDLCKKKSINEFCDFHAKRFYVLVGKDGKSYKSYSPGKLGGHRRLKIYGQLDCPSAARYIAKGQYTQHRVFFADEETAIAAGYRPCSYCMKEKYKKWKERQKQKGGTVK